MYQPELKELTKLSKDYSHTEEKYKKSRDFSLLGKLTETALDFFIGFSKLHELKLKPVEITTEEKVFEQAEVYKKMVLGSITPTPTIGGSKIGYIGSTTGTVSFVDVSHSTDYFTDTKNYTGFVIFNSLIVVVKTITEAFGGEFLEHTGDGALVFFRNRNYCETNPNPEIVYTNNSRWIIQHPSEDNPLGHYLSAAEYLKKFASDTNLISIKIEDETEIPSLIHIGACYGPVTQFKLGNVKKLVSKTVWDAANNCKEALRIYKISNRTYNYYVKEIPVKLSKVDG